jgi:hypothetical protein
MRFLLSVSLSGVLALASQGLARSEAQPAPYAEAPTVEPEHRPSAARIPPVPDDNSLPAMTGRTLPGPEVGLVTATPPQASAPAGDTLIQQAAELRDDIRRQQAIMEKICAYLERQPAVQPAAGADPAPATPATTVQQLQALQQELSALQQQAAPGAKDTQAKQMEILQKQVQTQQKMIDLLAQQMKLQAGTGLAVTKLQTQTAVLESRSQQAARRDDDVAHAIDELREERDADRRYGPELPAQLKELFLPSGNSETVLSIYGALSVGFEKIIGNAAAANNFAGRPPTYGNFYFGEFTPDFLVKLNDWILLEAELSAGTSGSIGAFAQADFFVNDWLTVIAGRFVAPIGFFNERLNNPWVNKLPTDTGGSLPLLWLQVLPPFSMLGVQAQGACYIGCSPIKFEYNVYASNGLNLPATPASLNDVANLENMQSTFPPIATNEKAVGGRLGLWWPEMGLAGGFSAMYNGDYLPGGPEDSISLWALDFNYHKGNWDVRAEGGITYQQAQTLPLPTIKREGFYGQVAYRPYDACCKYIQNLEWVYRYSYVVFPGIDENEIDITTFATPIDVPFRRQQNEFGVNYYFYRRLVLKMAYQVNDEPHFHLHDNQFIAELDWGW